MYAYLFDINITSYKQQNFRKKASFRQKPHNTFEMQLKHDQMNKQKYVAGVASNKYSFNEQSHLGCHEIQFYKGQVVEYTHSSTKIASNNGFFVMNIARLAYAKVCRYKLWLKTSEREK